MSITPKGINTLEAYTWYREGKLLVNRRYQRKLVWTVEEKQKLIDSIIRGYPLPLILLMMNKDSCYEIIDGMQRLNAIFSFIETNYSLENKQYFDLNVFPYAKLIGDKGLFKAKKAPYETVPKEDCMKVVNYQLAVTIFSAGDEKINDVFSRINSSGRQLSNQEKRQAGVVSGFSDLVRDVSSEIRGDVSHRMLKLFNMPVISIDTKKESHGYEISAENTLWCRHGILSTKDMRKSDDEEMIADILASILLAPSVFARSKDKLDALYGNKAEAINIEKQLKKYGSERLKKEIKTIFSLIDGTVKKYNTQPNILRKTIMGKRSSASSIKASFYALFMAFYELVIKESKSPADSKKILKALQGAHKDLKVQTKHITTEQRRNNINKIKGLIQDYFVKKEPKQILHGHGLEMDLENSFNRSKIETPHYEFKQGFLKLDHSRSFDKKLVKKLAETACGMANIGPDRESYIHIGVADRKEHADKIKKLDSINPKKINGFQVVGIDREAKIQKKTLEKYVESFVSEFKKIKLSDHLKFSILKNMDTIKYHGLSVMRLKIEPQIKISYVDNQCFIRENNQTQAVNGPKMEAIYKLFNEKAIKKDNKFKNNHSKKTLSRKK